jgi:hypothetical protein
MFAIQFIDHHTGNSIEGVGTREWPAVPRPGDNLVLSVQPVRQFKVINATWVDPMRHPGKLLARLVVEEVA